jgi:hypothetical protein
VKPTLLILACALLACVLTACADKPQPRDARRDSARLSKEPLDPSDLNGKILRGVGLP